MPASAWIPVLILSILAVLLPNALILPSVKGRIFSPQQQSVQKQPSLTMKQCGTGFPTNKDLQHICQKHKPCSQMHPLPAHSDQKDHITDGSQYKIEVCKKEFLCLCEIICNEFQQRKLVTILGYCDFTTTLLWPLRGSRIPSGHLRVIYRITR